MKEVKQAMPLRRLQLTTQDRRTLVGLLDNNDRVFAIWLQNMMLACKGVNVTADMRRNEGDGAFPFVVGVFNFRSRDEIESTNLELGRLVDAVHARAKWLIDTYLPNRPEPVRKRWADILVVLAFEGDATIKQDRSRTGRPKGQHPDTAKDLTDLANHIQKLGMSPVAYITTFEVSKDRYYRALKTLKKR